MTSVFPNSIDKFNQVEDCKDTVYANHINEVVAPIPLIQDIALNVVLSDHSAETDGAGNVRRRNVVLNSHYVDSVGPVAYCDVDVSITDNDGNKIVGAWMSKDYAVTVQIVNAENTPSYPANLIAPDTTTNCKPPYPYTIIGYKDSGATATIRLFVTNASTVDNTPIYLLKTDPAGTKIYALCGNTLSDMKMLVWDAGTKTFLSDIRIDPPSGYDTGTDLMRVVRDFCIVEYGAGTRILMLTRGLDQSTLASTGSVQCYNTSGKLLTSNFVDLYNVRDSDRTHSLRLCSSITSDTSGCIYISAYDLSCGKLDGHTGGQDTQASVICKFSYYGMVGKFLYTKQYYQEGPGSRDSYGDHFSYSWIYGLTYCSADNHIYASIFNLHHMRHGLGDLNPHPNISKLDTNLYRVKRLDLPRTSDFWSGGQIAPVVKNGKTYAYVTQLFAAPNYLMMVEGPTANQSYNHLTTEELLSEAQCSIRGFDIDSSSWSICNRAQSATSRPTGVVATADGKVYYTHYKDSTESIFCMDGSTLAMPAEPDLRLLASRIKAVIHTTVVSCADTAVHLRAAETGNFVQNADFAGDPSSEIHQYISPGYNSGTNRAAVLLRDKPTPTMSNALSGSGWGSLLVDMPNVWHDQSALGDIDTSAYRLDTSQGIRDYTTTAACVTRDQVGFIKDPDSRSLYVPAAWLGKNIISPDTDLQDFVEAMCMATPDTVPTYTTSTTRVRGTIAVPVIEARLPRTPVAGDGLRVGFRHSAHCLYRIQNQVYDDRSFAAVAFLMCLDANGNPLSMSYLGNPVIYPDGSDCYRLDMRLSRIGTGSQYGNLYSAYSVIPDRSTTHLYKVTPTTDAVLEITCPIEASYIRLGFGAAVYSTAREDNILKDTGESGGLYIDNVAVSLSR